VLPSKSTTDNEFSEKADTVRELRISADFSVGTRSDITGCTCTTVPPMIWGRHTFGQSQEVDEVTLASQTLRSADHFDPARCL